MKVRPIIFNGDMVRAILDGRKTQTRRVMKPMSRRAGGHYTGWILPEYRNDCPYGQPGDLLYVRETFQAFDTCPPSGIKQVAYRADDKGFGEYADDEIIWRPSIHMPRWASRITLEITDVRVERLQDISEEDASAEGVPRSGKQFDGSPSVYMTPAGNYATAIVAFQRLWDSIYGTWDANPWVWVVEFKPILKNVDEVIRGRA